MDLQEHLDTFYFRHGKCCAGCDWWHTNNSVAGGCTKSAPMSGTQRAAMLGLTNVSCDIGAGHAMTRREHVCGDFKDDFDWASLPLPYRKRIGDPTASEKV